MRLLLGALALLVASPAAAVASGMIRVALVESADHVCCRYRLAAFMPLLASVGHTLELRPRFFAGTPTLAIAASAAPAPPGKLVFQI